MYRSRAGVSDVGGVGGASISTTGSMTGLGMALLVSTDRNSSISSQADGSADKFKSVVLCSAGNYQTLF